ncbi:MAG: DegV family protein [Lachnospiraceae bacterium]|nr:DegV family protein [Lachnospiraceae bacterium]
MKFNITTDANISANSAKRHNIMVSAGSDFDSIWRPALEAGTDILHLSVSSSIGDGYEKACTAANAIKKEFPGRKVLVFDTLSISLGEILQVMNAVKLRDNDLSLREAVKLLLVKRDKLASVFAAGSKRISKPIFKSNYCGEIVMEGRAKNTRLALKTLVDKFKANFDKNSTDPVGIAYVGCPKEAGKLLQMLKKIAPNCDFLLTMCEPGSLRFGKCALALFYTCA